MFSVNCNVLSLREVKAFFIKFKIKFISSVVSAIEEQKNRHEEATKNFTSRLQSIDVTLEVNKGRQADLMQKLEELRKEEDKLKNNRMFENQIQERADCVSLYCNYFKSLF